MMKLLTTHGIPIVLALLVGTLGGYFYQEEFHTHTNQQIFSKGQGSGLTNPLLECGVELDQLTSGERASLEKAVQAFVDKSEADGLITDTAIYFRDLNNGPWFGINERKAFQPGSLLKLPIAMSYYYWEQRQPGVMQKGIDLTKPVSGHATSSENNADPSLKLVPPGVYTVHDLIGIMLRDSNNDAANILAQYEGPDRMSRVFNDLGIDPPQNGETYTVTVKTYGAFLRVLYNASYLGQVASEEILTTLTQASFRDGLVAGVPSSARVAHKYGTRIIDDPEAPRQLHDCGIVYAARTPYVLCVMTQGTSMKNLERFIAGVSQRVYDGVTK